MSQALILPDELFERLRQVAERQNLSVEQLLEGWITATTPDDEALPSATVPDDLLVICTHALLARIMHQGRPGSRDSRC